MRSETLVTFALAAAAACGALQVGAQNASQFEAGKSYTAISPAQPTSSDADKVEVTEIFMFGCPGCFAFEPHLQKWLPTKADYVSFVRVPAPWNPMATLHARAYYAAEALGKLDEIDGPFFNEFHINGNHLDTEADVMAFFGNFGVDEATFKNAFNSFAVSAKLKRAEELIRRYGVQSTPTVVVSGKYLTTGSMAGSYENWFAIINELAAREHTAIAAGTDH
jgi:thiol:disulfide interchange protein DsbA